MKRNITFMAYVLTLNFIFQQANAQTAGDFRTKTTLVNNNWFTVGNWETFDGTTWVNAGHYPTSADGVITLVDAPGGALADSLGITGTAITLDQVVVSDGAKLGIYLVTVTVNNGAGDDIIANGRLYFGNNAIVNGTGTVKANSTGWLFVRNGANLGVSAVHDGYGEFSGNATITGSTFTNNGTIQWLNNFLILSSSTFNNNGNFVFLGTGGNRTMNGGTFNNLATGSISGTETGSVMSLTGGVTFNNAGTIKGQGVIRNDATTPITNTGNISPGDNGPGLITLDPEMISGQPVTLNIQIVTNTPGTGHDKINIDGSAAVNISTVTLNVTEVTSAPVGDYTILEIINTAFPTFTGGAFLAANRPPTFRTPEVNASIITIQKLFALPVTWGSFTALQTNGKIALDWSTLQEINVSHFVVEHSTDGQKYTAIGNVTAVGNSNEKNSYAFVHSNPQRNGRNFYRILEVDLDGKAEYSVVRTVKLGDNSGAAIAIRSNPVQNGTLLLESDITNASAFITGINGAVIKEIRLHQGINNIDVSGLPAGIYTVNAYDSKSRIFSGRFVKK